MNSFGINSSADAFSITPSDTEILEKRTRAIYVGGSGNLFCELWDSPGETITFNGVLAGNYYPLNVRKVLEATTATNLIGLI